MLFKSRACCLFNIISKCKSSREKKRVCGMPSASHESFFWRGRYPHCWLKSVYYSCTPQFRWFLVKTILHLQFPFSQFSDSITIFCWFPLFSAQIPRYFQVILHRGELELYGRSPLRRLGGLGAWALQEDGWTPTNKCDYVGYHLLLGLPHNGGLYRRS